MTESPNISLDDPYVRHAGTRPTDVGAERAAVEQDGHELDNHVGVRHASALYTGAYGAARALVVRALGDRADTVSICHQRSEITYSNIPVGPIVSGARRRDPDRWDEAAASLDAGRPAEVATDVVSTNEQGRTVVTLESHWRVEPR